MSSPPLNIDYWATRYSVYTDYAEQYEEAMSYTCLTDKAEALWEWKGLNRSIPFEEIAPVIDQLDRTDYIDQKPQKAIRSLSDYLNDADVVSSKSLVTSAFLLHLMASGPKQYSEKFPIYDRNVWNAYVYLWRIRDKTEKLYSGASQSASRYAEFCEKFRETCPDEKARKYERALFVFGDFITDLSSRNSRTSIKHIDNILESQEMAIKDMQSTSGYALIDVKKIEDANQ
ncbi:MULTISPECIES: hypothetical protein [Halobellus]|uniref:hypothetical protein n=1 Tax=Halobellus TaxID=1073986 RepID=UPI00211476BE|nr:MULTISPECIES: hypothetical protein [Halobellus]MDQ2054316.1 hypothetical protein [Halobellus sp. H-GB7]